VRAAILYNQFLDHEGKEQRIGGVETYLLNLARLCRETGRETTVYQWSRRPFERSVDGVQVKGVPVCHLGRKKRNRALFRQVVQEIDPGQDLLIFGADHVSVPTKYPRCISIQHGIGWDLPARYMMARPIARYAWAARLQKWRSIQHAKRYFENCRNTVCVDYNFLNWYRTTVIREPEEHRIWVIPNFAPIASAEQWRGRRYEREPVRVLFARRFVEFRGTRLMAEVAARLLVQHQTITFTFAGEGPDESWLRAKFAAEGRVAFTKYRADETLHIHLGHDVAVVPSVASEGTSLAVAEAMAAGCAVVATAVGGITNMIIHRYNGLLVVPNARSLYEGITATLQGPDFRRQLGTAAFATASAAFNLERWKQQWRQVLEETAQA
jgi:glycosyltransferase involved in cell wall biosynthesis